MRPLTCFLLLSTIALAQPFTPAPADKVPIPARDLPAGTPPWMFAKDGWAVRAGATPAEKRANISITIPKAYLPKG